MTFRPVFDDHPPVATWPTLADRLAPDPMLPVARLKPVVIDPEIGWTTDTGGEPW